MGLFPDGTSSTGPNSPKIKKFMLGANRSASTGDSTGSFTFKTSSTPSTTNRTQTSSYMQQLSTSWEFIRPLDYQEDGNCSGNDKDDPDDLILPPRFIEIQKGKISLGPPKHDAAKDREVLEARIAELEESLTRLQDKVNQSQCSSPTIENELKEQLEIMSRAMKTKDRRVMQACRDHKELAARCTRQENSLQTLQTENKTLHQRIQQYEHCLDDVMRKVVDAIVAEDGLRVEVSILKSRVHDLEAQNAALVGGSPAKGRDEGYCTMSSGQPPPNAAQLEDLPEEPEQWLISAEPCTAEMEDWSMSQEELEPIVIEEDSSEWMISISNLCPSTSESQSENINALLQDKLVYSDDEEMTYSKQFTHDFYRLVNINADSTRSLQSKKSFNKKSNLKNNTEEDDEEDDGGLIDDTENDNLSQLSTDSSSSSGSCSNTSSCCNLTTLQQHQKLPQINGGSLTSSMPNTKKKKKKKQLLTTKQIEKIKLKLYNNCSSINNHHQHNNVLINNYNNRRCSRSNCNSPTPSEAGRAELISCSSSSDSISIDSCRVDNLQIINNDDNLLIRQRNSCPIQFKYNQQQQKLKHNHHLIHHHHQQQKQPRNIDDFLLQSSNDWPLSNGWHSKQLNNTNLTTSNNLPLINSFNNSKIIKTTGIPVATQPSHQTTVTNGGIPVITTTGNQTTIIPTTITPTTPTTNNNNNNKIKPAISKLNKQQKPPPVPTRRSAAS